MHKYILSALTVVALSLGCTVTNAQVVAKPAPKHAAVRLALAVVKSPYKGAKGILYSALFTTEVVVDGARVGLETANKVLDVVSVKGKVPVLDSLYSFVSVSAKDAAKLDGWLERQEQGLFGTHN